MYLAVERTKQYADQTTGLRCEQLIVKPTRIMPTRQSVLDHIYVNNLFQPHITESAVVNHDISDHLPTYINLKLKISSRNKHEPYSRNITIDRVEKFLVSLEQILDTPELKYNTEKDKLINAMKILTDVHFPKTKRSNRRNNIKP